MNIQEALKNQLGRRNDIDDLLVSPLRIKQEQDIGIDESETISVMQDVREYEPDLGMLDPANLKDWLEGSDNESESSSKFAKQSLLGSHKFKEGHQDLSTFNQSAVESTLFDLLNDERYNDEKFEFDENEAQRLGDEIQSELAGENVLLNMARGVYPKQ